MVENGSHGGTTAAPMARKVMDFFLLGKLPDEPLRKDAALEGADHD